jgi:hypothetical protein
MPGAPHPQAPAPVRYETPAWPPPAGVFFILSHADRLVIRLKTDGRKMTASSAALRTSDAIFASLAVQIMSQLVDGELVITNNIFDQIADRDDSDQFSLVNDGKVANSLLGHHCHAFFRS